MMVYRDCFGIFLRTPLVLADFQNAPINLTWNQEIFQDAFEIKFDFQGYCWKEFEDEQSPLSYG